MLRGLFLLIISALLVAGHAMIRNGIAKTKLIEEYPRDYMDLVKQGTLMSIFKRENPEKYYCGCQGCYHPLAQVCAYCCALNL
ncbi:unnamed protein product [Enterobius vermicularis]|uniref:Secreted protein n=1 Tax=Enterobius vermicularis TaxID=51028 RepID=A0A0N4VKP6_ENTVE|nr:unnamed protein product [Enterobius vermicularis]